MSLFFLDAQSSVTSFTTDELWFGLYLCCTFVGFIDQDFGHSFNGDGEGDDGVVHGRRVVVVVAGAVVATVRPTAVSDKATSRSGFVGSTGAQCAKYSITSLTEQKFLKNKMLKISLTQLLTEFFYLF